MSAAAMVAALAHEEHPCDVCGDSTEAGEVCERCRTCERCGETSETYDLKDIDGELLCEECREGSDCGYCYGSGGGPDAALRCQHCSGSGSTRYGRRERDDDSAYDEWKDEQLERGDL